MTRYALPLLALSAAMALGPAPASAQPKLSEAQVSALASYAMPLAFRGVQRRCANMLTSADYIYAQGDALTARLQDAAIGQFEPARDALLAYTTDGNVEMTTLLSNMPAEALEPFIAEIIAAKVYEEIEEGNCADINRMLELLDPLPARNLSELIGVAAMFAGDKAEAAAETQVMTQN